MTEAITDAVCGQRETLVRGHLLWNEFRIINEGRTILE